MEEFLKIWPVVAFLVVQTGAGLWWVATANEKLKRMELDLASRHALGLGERMTKIEVTMTSIAESMDDIKEALKARRRT